MEEDEFEVDKNARSAFLGMKYKLTIYEFEWKTCLNEPETYICLLMEDNGESCNTSFNRCYFTDHIEHSFEYKL